MRRKDLLLSPYRDLAELERLWHDSPWSVEFTEKRHSSKWGERIREEVVDGIRSQQPQSIEDGILFLEVSPRYYRSGYSKAWIARALKVATLTATQKERLRRVIFKAIDSDRVGIEFAEYARLAIAVADAAFVQQVSERPNSERCWVQRRINRLTIRLNQFCPPELTE